MKKYIALLTILAMLFCMIPSFAIADTTFPIQNTEYLLKGIDGNNVSTLAKNGKAKILFFFNTTCIHCHNIEDDLIEYGFDYKNVDIIMSESSNTARTQKEVQDYFANLGLENITACYDSRDICWSYLRNCGYTPNAVIKPVIVYIDAENNIKGYTTSSTNIFKSARKFGIILLNHENHKYDEAWESDDQNHWHECYCGEKTDISTHTVSRKTTAASEYSDGYEDLVCTTCSKRITVREISKIENISLQSNMIAYTGKKALPTVIASDENGKKIDPKFFTVKPVSDCTSVGRQSCEVSFSGDYKGTMRLKYTIIPASTTITKIVSSSNAIKLRWKKVKCGGYQIRYSLRADMHHTKSVKVSANAKSKRISKLKSGKKYFVQVRCYKKVSGKTFYSQWCSVKSIKTK